jgi:GNAT superfamily N-acetyltransferase
VPDPTPTLGRASGLDVRAVPFDHADAVELIAQLQQVYVERYGDADLTPVDPAEFAAPHGHFVVGYDARGAAVACGGWRARDGASSPTRPDTALRPGDAEIKRMYVVPAARGRGHARAVLAELERTAAAAGRRRLVLETGILQPEAIALYTSSGYEPIAGFGVYRCAPGSRCFAKATVTGASEALGRA